MAISEVIQEAKNTLEEIKRKYRFKKARMLMEDKVELQVTLTKCRGKLEVCKKDFNRAINTQSRNINEGRKIGADTIIQEQILWDAAIGYMLVRDAIFALETISSYDAVSHAYEMLDAAMKQIAGKKNGFPKGMKVGQTNERNAYGYITSNAALKSKEEMLDGFFEELKLTGNIEAHLAKARMPGDRQAERRYSCDADRSTVTESEDLDAYMSRLSNLEDSDVAEADFAQDMSSMLDIHPPKDSL